MATDQLSVGEAARRLPGANAKDITDLFYRGALRADLCPIVGGRRLIPADYLPVVQMALIRAGKLRRGGEVANGR